MLKFAVRKVMESTMDEMINEELQQAVETVEPPVETDEETEIGNVKISVDVVATIAGIAASQVNGVAGMYVSFAGGIVEKLGAKKNPSKGVKVEMGEGNANIDIYIVVEYGVRIPELSWEIQESVKNNVETMTGLNVEKVNIHIEGVSFDKADEDEEEKTEE